VHASLLVYITGYSELHISCHVEWWGNYAYQGCRMKKWPILWDAEIKTWIISTQKLFWPTEALKIQDNLKNLPVVMYGAECWALSQSDEPNLDMFQRIVLWMIFGLIKYDGVWRSKCAIELCTLYKDPKLTAEEEFSKRMLCAKIGGKKKMGTQKQRWLDEVNGGATWIRMWWCKASDGEEWGNS